MSSRVVPAIIVLVLVSGAAVAWLSMHDQNSPAPPRVAVQARANQAAEIARTLAQAWPDRPEWLDMYTAILDDEKFGPDYGWFRTAVTRTRFGWDATRQRYDRDHDAAIARNEFPGSDTEFARLDRDQDQRLSAPDFDFVSHYAYQPNGAILSSPADRDARAGNAREALAPQAQGDDKPTLGPLSKAQIEMALLPGSRGLRPIERPSKTQLVDLLFRQQMGSLQPGPQLDDPAPDFTLQTGDGKSEITLSKLIGPRPVVLLFGNFTCGQFRHQGENIETLHHRYGDRASFVMVYVREAHPIDGWRFDGSNPPDESTAQPKTYDERAGAAQVCSRALGLGFPLLVDTIDDSVGHRYSAMPARFYLIDRQGKIAFKNGRGPFGIKPDELEHALIWLLQEAGQKAAEDPVDTAPDHKQP